MFSLGSTISLTSTPVGMHEHTNTPEHKNTDPNTDTHMHKHKSTSRIRLTWTAVRVGRSAQAGPGHQLIPTLAPKLSWSGLNSSYYPEKYTAPKLLIMIHLSRIRSTILHKTSHEVIMHNCSLPESSLSNWCRLSHQDLQVLLSALDFKDKSNDRWSGFPKVLDILAPDVPSV